MNNATTATANLTALRAAVVVARAEADRLAFSYSNLAQGKTEPDDAYLARRAYVLGRRAASDAAGAALIAALIALAAAEDAAAAAA